MHELVLQCDVGLSPHLKIHQYSTQAHTIVRPCFLFFFYNPYSYVPLQIREFFHLIYTCIIIYRDGTLYADVAMSTVTWPQHMGKLLIQEVVEPHYVVVSVVHVGSHVHAH